MRLQLKILLIITAITLLMPVISYAQSGYTQVTAIVTDSNGTRYVNAPFSVTFFDPGTSGKLPLLSGSTFQKSYNGISTDGSGNINISLPDNGVIASTSGATGTQWVFSICTAVGAYTTVFCIPSQAITITGNSQNISSILTAAAPILPTSSGSSILLQTNGSTNTLQTKLNLISGPNITLGSDALGNVTITSTGGGGGGTPGGTNGQLQYNNSGVFGGFTLGGDCIISIIPNISCTKTGGVSFAPSATIDATNASNLSSGTVAAARLGPNVVQAITNDTNITGVISGQNLTLGWQSLLAVSRGGIGINSLTGIAKGNGTSPFSIAGPADVDSLYSGSGKCYLFKGTTPGTNDGCDNPTGAGTVTHTSGALTLNDFIFGNGGADIKDSGFSIIPPLNGGCGISNPTIHTLFVAEGSSNCDLIGPGLTGQSIEFVNSSDPIAASPGIPGSDVNAATYTVRCDNSTTLLDRVETVRFITTSSTVTIPDPTTSGCGSNFTTVLIASNVTLTVNRTSTAVFNIYNGNTVSTGQSTFTLVSGQYATISSPDNTNYIVRITTNIPVFPSTVAGTTNSGGIICFTSTTQESSSATLSANTLIKGGGSGVCPSSGDIQDISNLINSTSNIQTITYAGGQDSSANASLGSVVIKGADQTGAGGASSSGGDTLIRGGNNAATNAASTGGNVEILPGASTGATQGLPGLLTLGSVYTKGATVTQWNLECESASLTITDCAASPTSWVGVAEVVNTNTVQIEKIGSQSPINASAAVTLGHTVCAGSTAGKVTDSAGTGTCSNSQGSTVGIVMAISGTWSMADGTTFTASTTLPLIDINPAVLLSTGGGGGATFQANGTNLSNQTTINFVNGTATDGITINMSNPSAGQVAAAISGTLTNAGLANPSTTVNGQTCTLGSTCTVNPPFDKSTNGLADPTADATFTQPATSTSGWSLAGTAPASSGSNGTAATTLFNVLGVTGGATSSTGVNSGGIGSSPTISGGTGGAATGSGGTTTVGGAGGSVTLTGGTGGAGSAGNNSGGVGGNINLTPGSGGAKTGTGTAGAAGIVQVTGAMNATVSVSVGTAPACIAGTAGAICETEGTAPTNVASTDAIYPDSTSHEWQSFTAGSTTNPGLMVRRQPSPIHQTAQTAAISTATLCASSAGACNVAGQYHLHFDFIETGTACSVPGTGGVTFLLTWTDSNATTHSAVSLGMDDASAINSVSQTFHFQSTLAAAWGSGDFNISTNGSIIQYATGYTACGTGTGTYQLDASITRLQ